ncbi:hypothetical protein [Ensifer aridi]
MRQIAATRFRGGGIFGLFTTEQRKAIGALRFLQSGGTNGSV